MGQEAFGDIPLFRELQRLLESSEGPINFEIARQIAVATATEGAADPTIGPDVARSFADAVHAAEGVISGYTRLPLVEPLVAEPVGRARWATVTLHDWRWLLERLAQRFSSQLAGTGDAGGGAGAPMAAALGQMGPLLMGMQVGTLIGHLAREALGRYDFPIPRDDALHLLFVVPNLDAVASDYGLEIDALRRWVAAHDVARHLVVMSVPWARRYYRGLLIDVVDSIELDMAGLEQRLTELQTGGMEAMEGGLGPEALIPLATTERSERARARVKGFLAVFEGYAGEALRTVGSQLMDEGSAARVSESMTRYQLAPSEGEAVLSSVLGIALDRRLEQAGATFCKAVIELKGLGALNRVWEAPDNLPSTAEIKDPFSWIERVLDDDSDPAR